MEYMASAEKVNVPDLNIIKYFAVKCMQLNQ